MDNATCSAVLESMDDMYMGRSRLQFEAFIRVFLCSIDFIYVRHI